LIVGLLVLAIFLAVDIQFYLRDHAVKIRVRGWINFVLIGMIIGAVLGSAVWKPGISPEFLGTHVALQNLLRDVALVGIALLSLWITPDERRTANGFTFGPIKEVAKLFAGIFIAIIAVLAMPGAGKDRAFAGLLSAV
jgi:Na+/H+ antiporter NhaD/arsenite permease-like protein